eukprot:COSAG01_NODE_12658_length_1703_cov_1.236908_3_plen_73_part_01
MGMGMGMGHLGHPRQDQVDQLRLRPAGLLLHPRPIHDRVDIFWEHPQLQRSGHTTADPDTDTDRHTQRCASAS